MDEENKIASHLENIVCPGCQSMQSAEVEHTRPWWSYVHTCTECGYIIMESEWDVGSKRSCRVCGCTDDDCSGCVERTGEPCYWIEDDLCSACK